ncbi:sensor histidine kinase [Rummeliibacillus pycnus]|uniref:sensor histidine kinase n=1 Tax=Rummeliibacillus pycnus TaxID=101070 RepID=UPI0037C65C56
MKSLYSKFVIISIAIMFMSGVIAFMISNTYYQQKLKPYNDEKNTKIALDIAKFTDSHPNVNLKDYLNNIASVGYQLYLVDDTGNEQYFGADYRVKDLPKKSVSYVLQGHVYHGILHFPQETFVTGFFANELRNTIGVPLKHNGHEYALFLRPDIKLLFNEMHILFGILFALTFVLIIVFILISTKYLVKPITHLTNATHDLAAGNFNVQLDIDRKDEIGRLANSFSHMAQQLEQTEDIRKEFISNVSHDIQSPLSNIKGYTNLLEKENLSSSQKSQYIKVINGEINRLSLLTQQLLLLTSLDQTNNLVKPERIELSRMIKELVRQYQWAIGEKGIMLSYNLPEISIEGDPVLLNNVFDNLLTNAMKYNRDGGRMDISLEEHANNIIISFSDTGIGMTKEQQLRIFDRFYRADTSRTKSTPGTGLGLSIVKSIITMHHGSITVDSALNQGTTFTITLPKEYSKSSS